MKQGNLVDRSLTDFESKASNPAGQKVDALINLLQDEDRHVSMVAMEQLLARTDDVDELIAEYQEAPDPVLRSRIHQLGNIRQLRRARSTFIEGAKKSKITLWEGLLQINYQFNPRMDFSEIDSEISELVASAPKKLTTYGLTEFMQDENFTFPDGDILDSDLYLIEEVIYQRLGAPILLSVIAKEIGQRLGWHSSIVVYKGRHCLIDDSGNLIRPTEGWAITRLSGNDRLHSCSKNDTWLVILCQLFIAAMLEGRPQAIHRVGHMLSSLCGGNTQNLPFPLGS